jgi:hypothetical protein
MSSSGEAKMPIRRGCARLTATVVMMCVRWLQCENGSRPGKSGSRDELGLTNSRGDGCEWHETEPDTVTL